MKQRPSVVLCLLLLVLPLAAQAPGGAIGIEGLEVGVATAVPFGDFAEVADLGVGVQGRLPLLVATVPGLVLRPQAGVLYYISPLSDVTGIVTLTLDAAAGWSFPMNAVLTITPTVAYGVLVHLALEDSPSLYMGSGITGALQGSYAFSERLSVYLEPGYQFFLEEETHGHQLVIDAGVTLALGGER